MDGIKQTIVDIYESIDVKFQWFNDRETMAQLRIAANLKKASGNDNNYYQ